MSWNPFKKPAGESGEPPAPLPTPAPAADLPLADDDPTDPLGQPVQLAEQVTVIHQNQNARVEHVVVSNGQQGQRQLLRLIVEDDQELAGHLRQLFAELPEEFSGFKDLLLRPEAQYAAALTAPELCLADVAEGSPTQVPRVIDILGGISALARGLSQIELLTGLHWQDTKLAELGLIVDQPYAPAGYTDYRLVFTGWLNLGLEPGVRAQEIVTLFLPVLKQLADQAATHGFTYCAQQTQHVSERLNCLATRTDLTMSTLADELARPRLNFETAGATDVGQRRQHNEDSYLTFELDQNSASGARMLLIAVADGMGGHQSGEVASSLALDLLRQHLSLALLAPSITPVDTAQLVPQLEAIIPAIDRAISERAMMEPDLGGMGTTMAGFGLLDAQSTTRSATDLASARTAAVFNIGDSRAYLLGPAGLRRLTTDHSYVQSLVESGTISIDEAFSHPQKNVITRCIGGGISDGTPSVYQFKPGPGDMLLLCSDGLTDVLRDADLTTVIKNAATSSLPEIAKQLVAKANAGGGPDNITVVLVGICMG